MPLKNIPFIISPDLLKVLAEMGHGDSLVLADAYFPTSSICKTSGAIEIRADGHTIPPLLKAILQLLPLDTYVLAPVTLMNVVPDDVGKVKPTIWNAYKQIIKETDNTAGIRMIERFAFYDEAKRVYAIVHTGETSQYGNIIIQKGVVKQTEALQLTD